MRQSRCSRLELQVVESLEGEDGGGVEAAAGARWVGPVRLVIGLAAGLGFWLVAKASGMEPATADPALIAAHKPPPIWADQHPMAFAVLSVLVVFLPLIALAETGRMRVRRLLIYLGLATAALAPLAAYSIWRNPVLSLASPSPNHSAPFEFWVAVSVCLFIINQHLEHRERGRALFADYVSHFEDSWMRGAQFVLSVGFTVLVFLILQLGASLFQMIHLDWISDLVRKPWFNDPVLGVAFAAAVQISDIRPALLRGSRNLCLTLLAWVTPLLTFIAGGFLLALFFTGLGPLWATGHSASLLLSAGAVMLVALNAAYKGGDAQSLPPRVVRWAGLGAAGILLIFTGLASYAIGLRVRQYGWTHQRVVATALDVVLILYAVGYVWAALRSKRWMSQIEGVNVTASLAIVAVALAILTPLADPSRVAVSSQLDRIERRQVRPDRFDFQNLRFDNGRYGTEGLAALTRSDQPEVKARALRAQALQYRAQIYGREVAPEVTEAPLSHAVIYPKGATVPADFRAQAAGDDQSCLTDGTPCELYILPSQPQVIVLYSPTKASFSTIDYARFWGRGADGKWTLLGNNSACPAPLTALRKGEFTIVPSRTRVLVVGDMHFPLGDDRTIGCEDKPSGPTPKITAVSH
jgi:hypothetical protein